MARSIPAILSFNGGEIGARALARVDLEALYPKCASTMENCWASVQGPLSKMPGTEHFGSTPSNGVALLRPFVFDEDDSVVLELSNLKMRFIDPDAGLVTIAGAAATIGNFTNQSTGGASVTTGSTSTTFTGSAAGKAIAQSEITTAAPSTAVTLSFSTTRRPVKIRVGSSAGAQDIVTEFELMPGEHIITFTPSVSPYYFRATLEGVGNATLASLTRIAPGILELTTPWATADLPDLRYEQQRDAMWWYLGTKITRVLERRGAASWSLRKFLPPNGPFDPTNISDVTLTPNSLSGSATVTASADTFTSNDVDRIIGIIHQGQTVSDSFTGTSQITGAIRVTGIDTDRVFQISISGTWVGTIQLQRSVGNDLDFADFGSPYTANTVVNVDDGLDNQIIYYRLTTTAWTSGTATVTLTYSRGSTTGFCRIHTYTSATSVGVDIFQNFGKVTASTQWALGAWSTGEGWPVAGALFDSRHWLVRRDRVFGSVVDDYESFLIGSDASASIDRFLATGDTGAARWIEGALRLVVGTSGAAVEVKASSFDEPLTPDNMNARSVANRGKGSAPAQAEKVDKRIIYAGKNRKRLYQLVYDLDSNSYAPDDLTRLHHDVVGAGSNDGFVEFAIQYEPEPRIWGVLVSGDIAINTYAPEEGVYAWSRYVETGSVESVCCVPGTPEDRVFMVLNRTIDGGTVRYIEKLAPQAWATMPEAWRLRCALATENPADEVISGLDHLEGETVYAWADGRIQGPFTVASGDITLLEKAGGYDYVIVGLNYTGLWQSAKLSYGGTTGTALTQVKNFEHIGLITYNTPLDSFGYGYGPNEGEFNRWTDPDETILDETELDEPLEALSRDETLAKASGSSTDPRIWLIMDTPAPVEILALVPRINTHEK